VTFLFTLAPLADPAGIVAISAMPGLGLLPLAAWSSASAR